MWVNKPCFPGFMISFLRLALLLFSFGALCGFLSTQEAVQLPNPKHYTVLDSAFADINGDQVVDKVLVYTLKEGVPSDDDFDPRPTVVFYGRGEDTFEPILRNDAVVACKICGGVFGDPYEGMDLSEGKMTFYAFGGSSWRWSRTTSFTLVGKEWLLTECKEVSFHASDPEKQSTEYYHKEQYGRMKFEDFE